jgi:uncharacterized damage-inducible protein DinB
MMTIKEIFKDDKINSATVIDLVVHILEQAKDYTKMAMTEACEASAQASQAETKAIEAHDKIDEAIQELQEHFATQQIKDSNNQIYSEGE